MRAFLRLLALISLAALLVVGLLAGTDQSWLAALYLSSLPLGYLLFSMVPRQIIGWRRNAWKISAVITVGFVLLSLQLLRHQFLIADSLKTAAFSNGEETVYNSRIIAADLRIQRGRVYDYKGREIAGRIVVPGGRVMRTYPEPSAGYLVGYFAPGMYDREGLEDSYDDYLSGRTGDPAQQIRSQLLHTLPVGNDLLLSLDLELQKLAQQRLGDNYGAIAIMNPKTGAVRAMATNPTYDPQQLVVDPRLPRDEEVERVEAAWRRINNPTEARLINRATQGLYPPGSTFKILAAAAALDGGIAEPDTLFEDRGQFVVNGHVIEDPNRPDENKTQWTLKESMQYSLNAVFAQVGLAVGEAGLRDYATRFFFEKRIPFDLRTSRSQLASSEDFLSDDVALADTALGQGELLASPLQMLLTAATIANGGVVPQPYLVEGVRSSSGRTVHRPDHGGLGRAISEDSASALDDMLIAAVQEGSGVEARVPGATVAGKTGTAQLAEDDPHSWFVGYAPAEDPQVAVVVLIENGGEGYAVAAPIAGDLLEVALRAEADR